MSIITKQIGNNKFTFEVNSRSTRRGFAHDCSLYLDGHKIAHDTANYINRTWEAYRFQAVMMGAIDNAIEQIKADVRETEKAARGWAKLTQARKNEIAKIIEQNSSYKVLRALLGEVSGARYGTEEERQELESLEVLNTILEILCA